MLRRGIFTLASIALLMAASSCHTTQAVMSLTEEQMQGLLQVGAGLEKDLVGLVRLLLL